MFSWNFAKSAEALFSKWAVKKVCKFVLKKKLGHFILGDIDLDQLDVQLREGTIQLSDLALNVDYLNKNVRMVLSLSLSLKKNLIIISMGMKDLFFLCLSFFNFFFLFVCWVNRKNEKFVLFKLISIFRRT
jgi:hypothetical protein